MSNVIKKTGLILIGAIAGMMLSLNFSAIAKKESIEAIHPLPIEELRTFAQVFGRIKSDYVESVEDKKLITEAINGMLIGLDPHSSYLDKDEYKELQIGTQGEFGGLGIQVTMEDGVVKVISPIEDTPAFRAGIKTGDLIVKLDDTVVKGMTLNDAIKLMRGKPNTSIKITIVREGETEPLVFNLVRDIIKIQSVKSKMIEPGYAYIRITQFQEQTGENLAQAIKTLFAGNSGAMKGLILDLRNDPGGLLNGAVAVSAAFLPENALVVYTEGRSPDAKMKLHANPEYYLRGPDEDYLKGLPSAVKTVPMIT
ncbi:MAG: S41 family peptidase, partial [Nitrosomonas sp.]